MTQNRTPAEKGAEMRAVARWAYRCAKRLDHLGKHAKAATARELGREAARAAYKLEVRP